MQDFRNLDVWQFSHAMTLKVYARTRSFPREELYGLVSQMRRSSSSVPMNIAEGCVKKTDPDFARYLYHALGSVSELEYQVLLSHDLGYLSVEAHDELTTDAQRVKRMLIAFIRRLEGSREQVPEILIETAVPGQQPTAKSLQPHA